MTFYGVDLGTYQAGISITSLKAQGYSFVGLKATEGANFHASTYPTFANGCRKIGMPYFSYHWVRQSDSVSSQVANALAAIDKDVPIALDVEVGTGGDRPTLKQAAAVYAALRKAGRKVPLVYLPHWYWQGVLGSPVLNTAFPGAQLWVSNYGANAAGYAAKLYPGDTSPRWNGYGGLNVGILQFGSQGKVDGYPKAVDVNAIRLKDLPREWFYFGAAPAAAPVPAAKPAATAIPAQPQVTTQTVPPVERPLTWLYAHRGSADYTSAMAWSHAAGLGAVSCDLQATKQMVVAGARVIALGGPAHADLAAYPTQVHFIDGVDALATLSQAASSGSPA